MNNHDSACDAPDTTQETGPRRFRLFAGAALLLTAWFMLYHQLADLSRFLTYDIIGLQPKSHLGSAVEFFCTTLPKCYCC